MDLTVLLACAAKMVEDSELPHLPSFFETVTAIASPILSLYPQARNRYP